MAATLNLLWVSGWTASVTLIMLPGQKHSFMMVQPSPGPSGPLLTDR